MRVCSSFAGARWRTKGKSPFVLCYVSVVEFPLVTFCCDRLILCVVCIRYVCVVNLIGYDSVLFVGFFGEVGKWRIFRRKLRFRRKFGHLSHINVFT